MELLIYNKYLNVEVNSNTKIPSPDSIWILENIIDVKANYWIK